MNTIVIEFINKLELRIYLTTICQCISVVLQQLYTNNPKLIDHVSDNCLRQWRQEAGDLSMNNALIGFLQFIKSYGD